MFITTFKMEDQRDIVRTGQDHRHRIIYRRKARGRLERHK